MLLNDEGPIAGGRELWGFPKKLVQPTLRTEIDTFVGTLDYDARPHICELAEYRLEDVAIKGAWTGPAALHLSPHALAPVAELPVLEVVSAIHILADLTLGLGEVVHDYLREPTRQPPRIREKKT
jgi:acetoacetate decarboxylase